MIVSKSRKGYFKMTEQEINNRLKDMKEGLKFIDTIIYTDYKTHEGKLNERQVKLFRELIELFQELNWQINFNSYKELKYETTDQPIKTKNMCGKAVKIRSCRKEHGDKTYFGILLGDIPLSISHSIESGIVTARKTSYNPAIFVPELNDVIFGCESWWGEIDSEDELNKLITDETIQNVWYVKLLNQLSTKDEPNKQ